MSQPAIEHFDSVARLLSDLSHERIESFEHHYHPKAFGSFELVLGRGHSLVKFVWDGKDSILSAFFAKVQNTHNIPSWAHDADFILPRGSGVYQEVASRSVEMLTL